MKCQVKCQTCLKDRFVVFRTKSRSGKRECRTCAAKKRGLNLKGVTAWNKGKKTGKPSWNSGQIKKDTRNCLQCSKQFVTEAYQKYVYCSRVCSNRHRVAVGLHHWGKGGKTPLNFAVRTCSEYKKWRAAVIARDGFKCQSCMGESRPGAFKLMHVDHIVPLSFLFKEYHVTTLAEAKVTSELFDVNNGRVLCFDCHTQTDTYLTKALVYNK